MRYLAVFCFLTLFAAPVRAQLDQTFDHVFDTFLVEGFALSPGAHGEHFLPAADEAAGALTPALNSLIASNVASFPLSGTVAGISFDFSTGQPVTVMESLGPIFAETAETLGRRKVVVGLNATRLSLDRIRGLPLDAMRFTFLHQDVESPGLGNNVNESDLVDIYLDLDADATIFALYATYGITESLDLGVALPFVSVGLTGEARAAVRSFTLGILGEANHHFGDDSRDPLLSKTVPYDERASGLGDLAVRLKYRLPLEGPLGVAALLDARLPTGDEADFLGTGSVSVRGALVASRAFGDFTPHLNVGYDHRGAAFDSDEVEATLGFDQKIAGGVSFALSVLGEFDLQAGEAARLLPGTVTIDGTVDHDGATVRIHETVDRSNIPDRDHDHTLHLATGFRVAPSERIQLLANLLVPLQHSGLRSDVATTIGASVVF